MSTFQKDQVQDIYYLSPMQEGMLFHALLHPGESFYVEQIAIQINGSFRPDLLQTSMNVIVDRYDIFRTVFVHEKLKRPVQVVLNEHIVTVQQIDISHLSNEQQRQRISAYKQQDKEQGFDLCKENPMRTTVFKKGGNSYEWIWTYHHILLDGWCFGIVVQELLQVYKAFLQNKTYSLQSTKPYKEYINWLELQEKDKSWQYWADYLSEFAAQRSFSEQRKRGRQEGYAAEEIVFSIGEQESQAVSELAQEQRVTMSTAVQAAWAILLSRYQRADDVIFGTVVSGRPAELSGVENMVGVFINVVPTRVRLSKEITFSQLVADIQNRSVQAESHQYVPFYDIQSKAGNKELIDHIIVFENYPLQQSQQPDEQSLGFTLGEMSVFEQSNYNLNLVASPGAQMQVKIAYNANVYENSFILRLKDQLIEVIRQISQNPHMPIGDVQLVPEVEQNRLVRQFNPADTGETNDLTLAQRFERQAEQTPHRIALVADDKTYTFAELNAQANRFAHGLSAKGVSSGTIVSMLVQRSPELVIGILAILKAGGAYLPIDPEYPAKRIRYMLDDSGSQLMLTQDSLLHLVDAVSYDGVCLLLDDPALYQGSAENLGTAGSPDDLAYIMYTSGTTGSPKGSLTTHTNIARVVKNTNYLEITENDTLLSLSNYAFDGFTFDLYGALLNGAKLVLAQNETILSIRKLMQLIENQHISVMFVTTALFNLLVDTGSAWMKGVRKVLFGGERASVNHVRKALQGSGPGKIIHVYGPTESTVFATFYPVNEISEDAVAIPIGAPLNNTFAYILSPTNQLQPIEAVGELCLGGTGLARGYLNQPDVTAEKFVPHPFLPNERIYRTGDLARWLPDGSIEFAGRVDDQVKIRGHRIEVGEIEQQLVRFAGVKQAVVVAVSTKSDDTSLVAYVVGQPETALSTDSLRSYLTKHLPAYMLPAAYVLLDQLPLTSNGKVNRRLLPTPVSINQLKAPTQPRNEVESRLVELWSEVLGVKSIGIHDDFFELGGHSLKAMALCSQILKEFAVDVPVRILFTSPTIAGVSVYLLGGETTLDGVSSDPNKLELTILNPAASQNLFVFPPVLGYGIMFNDFAKQLPGYRVHAFDFVEAEQRIEQYASNMNSIQPEGSFALLGYSAGCSLAFEAAKALENMGRKVDVVIMVDSYKKVAVSDLGGRSVEEDVDALMYANKDNPYLQVESIRQGITEKMKAYYTYYVDLISTGHVDVAIHLVKSEKGDLLPPELSSWKEATTGIYREYQGYGQHDEMLQGRFAKLNGQIIEGILKESETKAFSELVTYQV